MIAHASNRVVIRRPVHSVFEFLLNGANNKLWKAQVREARPLGEPPFGAGSMFREELRGARGGAWREYRITDLEAPRRIGFQMTRAPLPWSGGYQLEPVDAGAAVACALECAWSGQDAALRRQALADVRDARDGMAALAKLSEPELRAASMQAAGKTGPEIARALFVGEGTARNYVASGLSKLIAAGIQRAIDAEVAELANLKMFLEKIA